jgi:predicted SprT family Zn-dependent metalloprotease
MVKFAVEKYWCKLCQAWYLKTDLIKWTGDDQLHYLCPGCDSDLVEPEKQE